MNQILCTEEYFNNKINKINKIEKTEKITEIAEIAKIEEPVKKQNKNTIGKHAKITKKINVRMIDTKNIISMIIVFCICVLFSYCIYACGIILKNEGTEKEVSDIENVVELENIEVEEIEEPETIVTTKLIGLEDTEYKSPGGEAYTIAAILNIPSLGIKYPVLSENSDELMEISLNKYWGAEPNEEGNCVIVGHNYLNKTHFGKLPGIQIGDEVEITDTKGRTVTYVVYKTYIIDPEDTQCTSQLTDGRTEITLITCANGGATRFVAKCVAIEK